MQHPAVHYNSAGNSAGSSVAAQKVEHCGSEVNIARWSLHPNPGLEAGPTGEHDVAQLVPAHGAVDALSGLTSSAKYLSQKPGIVRVRVPLEGHGDIRSPGAFAAAQRCGQGAFYRTAGYGGLSSEDRAAPGLAHQPFRQPLASGRIPVVGVEQRGTPIGRNGHPAGLIPRGEPSFP